MRSRLLCLLLPFTVFSSFVFAQDKDPFARWEKTIQKFEQQDKTSPPPKGGILFVGSSSIRLWKLDKSFPDLRATNRGFGGSEIADSTHFAWRIILKHKPKVVVLYAGDNDIAKKKTPERVSKDFTAFVATVHKELPKTKIAFLAIKPSIKRWNLVDKMKKANALIQAQCEKNPLLVYVDIFTPMLGKDGMPMKDLFAGDGLHLNEKGYQLWTKILRPHLSKRSSDAGTATGRNGMVVCVSPEAAKVGVSILKKGGNSVDAAIAVAFAMAVTYPQAGNIGGGGFMMIHPPKGKGKPVCIDYREKAPLKATKTMYNLKSSHFDQASSGVPGTVKGLALASEKYGKLPWKDLVMPAVELADKGFPINRHLEKSLNDIVKKSPKHDELRRVFGKANGKAKWKIGDRLVQKDLAKTLRLIAEKGPDAFYRGAIAELLVKEMQQGNGLISVEDLAKYEAKVRTPIHGTFRGYDVYGPPPPSSGGTVLVEMLNVLEQFDLKSKGRFSAQTSHIMIETMKRAYLDRAKYLGDADFVKIPTHLTTKEYAKKLAKNIDLDKAIPSEKLSGAIPLTTEGESTTHFSVIDREGMAVSNTYTLENSYGSRVVVRSAGFLLNNEMFDFNWRPGVTSRKGYIGTKPNQIAPEKRMLSSQTPTIVARDGKVVLVTGSPGGRTIINTVCCVVVNVLEFEMSVREAVDAPRLHHQWMPDVVNLEKLKDNPQLAEQLKKMGHSLGSRWQGDAHTIRVDPKTGLYFGAADSRILGLALGF